LFGVRIVQARHSEIGRAMRAFSKILAFFSVTILFTSSSYAATVTGTVKGPDGTPFKGAFVQARNAQTHITVSVLSDKRGQYRVENLPGGEYQLQVRALGFKVEAHNGVRLSADQNLSLEFTLEKGAVRWSDLSLYQGIKLLPEAKGKETLTAHCFVCHGFQTKMASTIRDESGWRDRVNYMREEMKPLLASSFDDRKAEDVISYLNTIFGQDSTLPRSPAEMPEYKDLVRPFSDEAMKIVYVEYDLPGPNRMPWSAAPDKDGNFWMPSYGPVNKVGRLDPKTAEVQEFTVPAQGAAGIHSVVPAPDGTAWFSEFFLNKIGKIDSRTGTITEYQDSGGAPGERPSKHTLRIDLQGNVWATGSPLSKFDPRTGKFTHFLEVPSLYGITMDKEGNIWFTVIGKTEQDGKIGKVDAKTEKVTQWSVTTHGYPRRIEVDASGIVWFGVYRDGAIGRFDPKTETFKEYQLPGPQPTPYALAVDKDEGVWYASMYQDVIGHLDPSTGKVIEYPFPHSEGLMREFFFDSQGRIWFATPTNNKVGYFYINVGNERGNQVANRSSLSPQ
jgi:virginiamycin B lyase